MNQDVKARNAPNLLLADALLEAKNASKEGILKHSDFSRSTRERLEKAGCLIEIIKGWYLLTQPEGAGTSTAWFGGHWGFVRQYLTKRFDKFGYCLSAESSLGIHTGESLVSSQITVITKKSSNQVLNLPHDTSLVLYSDEKNFPQETLRHNGVNVMPLHLALCRLAPNYFLHNPFNVELGLKLIPSVSEISRTLLSSHSVNAASRIAGAYAAMGEEKKSAQIIKDMEAAGHTVRTKNPFEDTYQFLSTPPRLKSPYTARLDALWKKMRGDVIANFPQAPGLAKNSDKPLKVIRDLNKEDAYHSLSIEGYQVTEDLIKKIANGDWDPLNNYSDKDQRDALAARGYLSAFDTVMEDVIKVLRDRKEPGQVAEEGLQGWYRQLFSPSVQAGLLPATALAGYRNQQVYINMSRHVPLPSNAVLDSMETLFSLLKEETEASVRAVLGHFIFVFIHPYMDGNGRVGRFLMNLMLVSGGYNWTVVRTGKRNEYLASLEAASAGSNIIPFTKFIASEMMYWHALMNKEASASS